MSESVRRGIAALRLYKGAVESSEPDRVVIEFNNAANAVEWWCVYAKRATVRFLPGMRIEVKS